MRPIKTPNASLSSIGKNMAVSALVTLILLFLAGRLSAQDYSNDGDFDWTHSDPLDAHNERMPMLKNVYFEVGVGAVVPTATFKEYSQVMFDLRLSVGGAFKKIPLAYGLALWMSPTQAKKDSFKGLEVDTQGMVLNAHPFFRWVPRNDSKVKPYIESSVGLSSYLMETTSEVVDEPTFLEEILFGEESTVETTTHKRISSSNISYTFGGGLLIGKLALGISYQRISRITYVDYREVYVEGDQIVYPRRNIPFDMVAITIAFGNFGRYQQ